jgi:hypothetical protein
LKKALSLRPGYREVTASLQRLGATSASDDVTISEAGIDTWRVVMRANRYFAVNDQFPRISVPLEMMGQGQPRLLDWELKKPPFKGIAVLRFYAGTSNAGGKPEDMESVAVLDVAAGVVIAVEPHRQGEKLAKWTWEEGKVTVASVDGATDEFSLRVGKDQIAGGGERRPMGAEPGWAPWGDPWATNGEPRPQRRKKSKTLFDLLFN